MTAVHKPSVARMLSYVLLALATVAVAAVCAAGYRMMAMPGHTTGNMLPPLDEDLASLEDNLRRHVSVLAGEIGERNDAYKVMLDQTAAYIQQQFEAHGYKPETVRFGADRFHNIVVTVPGGNRSDEILVMGAHYDSARGTPGADDNASGVAGLLEIARLLHGRAFPRTVRFIAFTNEEEPFYGTELMGSRVAAHASRKAGENIMAMYSLEMIGYFSDEPGTQRYPGAISHFYPERGNFIGFVSNWPSRGLLYDSISRFRARGTFPSEGMAAPEWLVPDIRRSDNASYWDYGFPALMITDTSNFRNPYYHTARDTPDTLNYTAMARVVAGLADMVTDLAQP